MNNKPYEAAETEVILFTKQEMIDTINNSPTCPSDIDNESCAFGG